MKRSVGIILALVVLAPATAAQDSRTDLANRLKALVDARLADLRTELHREIDAALTPSNDLGIEVQAASEEFRQLHRLPDGCGVRVASATPGCRAGRQLGLSPGDVVIFASSGKGPSRWVSSVADIETVLREAGETWATASAMVIRKGERVVTATPLSPGSETAIAGFDGPGIVVASETSGTAVPATTGHACIGGLVNRDRAQDRKLREAADQMADRLFEQAVRKVLPGPGTVLPQQNSVPESQPSPK